MSSRPVIQLSRRANQVLFGFYALGAFALVAQRLMVGSLTLGGGIDVTREHELAYWATASITLFLALLGIALNAAPSKTHTRRLHLVALAALALISVSFAMPSAVETVAAVVARF